MVTHKKKTIRALEAEVAGLREELERAKVRIKTETDFATNLLKRERQAAEERAADRDAVRAFVEALAPYLAAVEAADLADDPAGKDAAMRASRKLRQKLAETTAPLLKMAMPQSAAWHTHAVFGAVALAAMYIPTLFAVMAADARAKT